MLTQNCRGGLLLQRGVFLVSARDASIIADNLNKAGWIRGCVWAVNSSGRTIFVVHAHRGDGKRFVDGREKKSQRTLLRERPPRVGQEKSAPLSVPFAQLNRKTLRWEEVSQPYAFIEKSQAGTRPGFLGEISPQLKVRRPRSISPPLELERRSPRVVAWAKHKLRVPKRWPERPPS